MVSNQDARYSQHSIKKANIVFESQYFYTIDGANKYFIKAMITAGAETTTKDTSDRTIWTELRLLKTLSKCSSRFQYFAAQ